MNTIHRKFDELLIEIYKTNFEKAELKLNKFKEDFLSIIESDIELTQRVNLLLIETYKSQNRLHSALELSTTVLHQLSPSNHKYLVVSLIISELLISLNKIDELNDFIEKCLLKNNGLVVIDPISSIKILTLYKSSNNDFLIRFQDVINQIEQQLEISIDRSNVYQSLKDVNEKITKDGHKLTEILAVSGNSTMIENVKAFESFLKTNPIKTYQQEASNFLEFLHSGNY
ncbi:hypothetical protein ACFSUS_28900 [Spirosoma soli]|uniref:Tetratricopeptide repeat protein n=1 Tax=Spirosoma soli TaxID=1770529 RepID=A0ABW5MEA1_9BACT